MLAASSIQVCVHLSDGLESLGDLVVLVLGKVGVLKAGRAARLGVGATRTVASEDVGKVHAVSRNVVELDHFSSD